MTKRVRRRSSGSTTDSTDSESSSHLPPAQAKKARIPEKVPGQDGVSPTASSSTDSATAGQPGAADMSAPSIKIFNMNVNGVMKAFARKDKRLEVLLTEQGQ